MPCSYLLLAGMIAAQPTAPATLTPVTVPAYENVRRASHYASPPEYQAAVSDKRFALRRLSYASDALTVFAYVYGPRSPTAKQPVIIFNRGSWTWPEGFAGEFVTMAHRLAESGFVIVAPMYRGSGGAPGQDEMGGDDVHDLLNLRAVLSGIPGADAERIYLYGESRGGMMVYQALREGFPARAAAVVGAFADLDGMLSNPKWAAAGTQIWPDLARDRTNISRRRSAVQWPEKIGAPILIIHGAADTDVPPEQSLRMAGKLLELGKPVQLLIVEKGSHTISERAKDRDDWIVDWFKRH